jgi:hypothetical protein
VLCARCQNVSLDSGCNSQRTPSRITCVFRHSYASHNEYDNRRVIYTESIIYREICITVISGIVRCKPHGFDFFLLPSEGGELENSAAMGFSGIWFSYTLFCHRGPGSVVGIATGYELDGPGLNPGGGEIFRTRPNRPWGPPSLLYNGYRVFTGG